MVRGQGEGKKEEWGERGGEEGEGRKGRGKEGMVPVIGMACMIVGVYEEASKGKND